MDSEPKDSEAVNSVKEALRRHTDSSDNRLRRLERVEHLADRFSHVKPTPYAVPLERYAGMMCRREREHG